MEYFDYGIARRLVSGGRNKKMRKVGGEVLLGFEHQTGFFVLEVIEKQ